MCTYHQSHIMHGVPNTPRGAKGGAEYVQRIWNNRADFPREFGTGVPQTGDAKFPMTPAGCTNTTVQKARDDAYAIAYVQHVIQHDNKLL